MRRGPKPGKTKVEAKQAITRKSVNSDGSRVRDLEKRLAEALKRGAEAQERQKATAELLQTRNRELTELQEQQTATSELLKVISRSTFDLRPVLETLIENATRLCGADKGFIYRFDGEVLRMEVSYNTPPQVRESAETIHPGRDSVVGRVLLTRRVVLVRDITADPEYRHAVRDLGVRTILAVPMFRQETLAGVISIWISEVRSFTDKQIQLMT